MWNCVCVHAHPKESFEETRLAVTLHWQRKVMRHGITSAHATDTRLKRIDEGNVQSGVCTCPPTTTISGTASVSPKATAERCSALQEHSEARVTSPPYVSSMRSLERRLQAVI